MHTRRWSSVVCALLLVSSCIASSAAADLASADACAALSSCDSCTSAVGCGYCAGPAACLPGNSTGPFNPTACAPAAWVISPNECAHLPCATPLPPPDASFGTCLTSDGWTADGGECSFMCIDGFFLYGDALLQCNDGDWNGTQLCIGFDPSNLLPSSAFTMNTVDWFLLVFMSVWSFMILLLSILLLSGKILPHLGASPPNLTLWDLDAVTSKLQRQQRCRRWIVALLGNCVLCIGIAALATDQYSTATIPSDQFDVDVTFRAFGYELAAGAPFDFEQTYSYPSCDSADELGDRTLCYLFRVSLYGVFIFGLVGALASLISLILIFLVLLRFKRESWWNHAMKFNLCATGAFMSSVLLYAGCTHIVLKQLYDAQLNFELSATWFLFLGTMLLAGLWTCITYLYYRPTSSDEDEDDADHPSHPRRQAAPEEVFDGNISAHVRGGSAYGAMRDEDPFA
jgi:hypothetical protein